MSAKSLTKTVGTVGSSTVRRRWPIVLPRTDAAVQACESCDRFYLVNGAAACSEFRREGCAHLARFYRAVEERSCPIGNHENIDR